MACLAPSLLADFIYFDIGQPSGISPGTINYWIENSIGNLNTYLGTSHNVVSGDIVPGLNIEESGIMNQMYKVRYYNKVASENLGASAYDWSEVREADSVVRRVSKNEISKTYLQLAKDEKISLDETIRFYRTNAATPTTILPRVNSFYQYYGYGYGDYANGLPNTYRTDG
jgi:hypothetical protein